MQDRFEDIVQALKDKACLKQRIYRKSLEVFQDMKTIAEALSATLSKRFEEIDQHVVIEYTEINDFEFHLKFSGDLLIFTMHSNITRVTEEHILAKNPYVQNNPEFGFFGHIMVYNFMADSLKYKRMNDPGYLIARIMLNVDGHFYVEGVKQLNFLFPDIAENLISKDFLLKVIETTMLTAIGNDLYVPRYQDVQVVPLGSKIQNQMVTGGFKVGFQMVTQSE